MDDLAWLRGEVRMALVALGKVREAMEVLAVHLGCRGPREEEDRLLGIPYASLPREGYRALRETFREAFH